MEDEPPKKAEDKDMVEVMEMDVITKTEMYMPATAIDEAMAQGFQMFVFKDVGKIIGHPKPNEGGRKVDWQQRRCGAWLEVGGRKRDVSFLGAAAAAP